MAFASYVSTVKQITFGADDSRYSANKKISSFDKLVNCESDFPKSENRFGKTSFSDKSSDAPSEDRLSLINESGNNPTTRKILIKKITSKFRYPF